MKDPQEYWISLVALYQGHLKMSSSGSQESVLMTVMTLLSPLLVMLLLLCPVLADTLMGQGLPLTPQWTSSSLASLTKEEFREAFADGLSSPLVGIDNSSHITELDRLGYGLLYSSTVCMCSRNVRDW